MADLTGPQQEYLVYRLAHCWRVKDVVEAFNLDFANQPGAPIDAKQVARYNGATPTGQLNMGADLFGKFLAWRKEYNAGIEAIPLWSQRFRIEVLQDLLDNDPIVKNSPRLKMNIAEQIAKEQGGMYQQQQKGVPLEEALDMVTRRTEKIRDAILKAVPDEREQDRILGAVQDAIRAKGGAGETGGRSGPEGDTPPGERPAAS